MMDLVAPCGIDCCDCVVYIATVNDDPEAKRKLAKGYKAQYGKEIALEEVACDGCTSQGRQLGFCAVCQIRACAFGKGYHTCAQCADFPCETGQFIWTKNSKSRAKLEDLKANKS